MKRKRKWIPFPPRDLYSHCISAGDKLRPRLTRNVRGSSGSFVRPITSYTPVNLDPCTRSVAAVTPSFACHGLFVWLASFFWTPESLPAREQPVFGQPHVRSTGPSPRTRYGNDSCSDMDIHYISPVTATTTGCFNTALHKVANPISSCSVKRIESSIVGNGLVFLIWSVVVGVSNPRIADTTWTRGLGSCPVSTTPQSVQVRRSCCPPIEVSLDMWGYRLL